MAKYVVKRILLAIATIFIVCVITFFAMNAIRFLHERKAKSRSVHPHFNAFLRTYIDAIPTATTLCGIFNPYHFLSL